MEHYNMTVADRQGINNKNMETIKNLLMNSIGSNKIYKEGYKEEIYLLYQKLRLLKELNNNE